MSGQLFFGADFNHGPDKYCLRNALGRFNPVELKLEPTDVEGSTKKKLLKVLWNMVFLQKKFRNNVNFMKFIVIDDEISYFSEVYLETKPTGLVF